ncbi:hypothetical protein K6119_02530 [Paracrocinitomix mangrovi]|uniref:hypothetical protein n=1 Tax=Paracrocinitomix mangrovi TaxID=2862509 RepID=UPI001C8E38C5|nr:hypothetical protein [Paracrocinitomix mangrovi]UKN02395.1 hypothetical protein K6119_02530 [Paracrocinitomix mangrovi]
MKTKFLNLLLLISGLFLASSFSKNETSITYKKLYAQNVWSDIDSTHNDNSFLFKPSNKKTIGWSVIKWEMDLDQLEKDIKDQNQNLYTLFLYHVLKNEVALYAPFDPNWVDHKDKGLFKYPINAELYGKSKDGTFFTDNNYKNFVKEGFLGSTNWGAPLVAMQSIAKPGNDSINAKGDVVYYPREYNYYSDRDIIKYRIREEWMTNEAGEVVKKQIKAIAPVMNNYDMNGKLMGERILFWINYEDIAPFLDNYYTKTEKNEKKKVISYKDYFDDNLYHSTIVEKDSLHLNSNK